jgi:transposase-like protein
MEKTKGRKGQKGRQSAYPATFKRNVARDYIQGDESRAQVAQRYGIAVHLVRNWAKHFSSELAVATSLITMNEEEQKELNALQKELAVLKKQLEHEQMRNFALETMIDLAKEKLNIDVRKNFGAKQPEE